MANTDKNWLKARQAFYAGLAQCCLNQAWLQLDDYRGTKVLTRLFRGKQQERKGMPIDVIAAGLSRNSGELSRWFNGKSPQWANLLMVMTVLDAGWAELKELPSKKERRTAGSIRALQAIKSNVYGRDKDSAISERTITLLESLSAEPEWYVRRRSATLRRSTYLRVAEKTGYGVDDLEQADSRWGDEWIWWVYRFGESIDEQIWI
jgi:hypothetical protein